MCQFPSGTIPCDSLITYTYVRPHPTPVYYNACVCYAYYKVYLPRVQPSVWQFQLCHILSWPHTPHNIVRGNLEQKSSWRSSWVPVPIIALSDLVVNTNQTRKSSSNLVHKTRRSSSDLDHIIARKSSCVNTNKTRRSSWLFMSWFPENFASWVDRSGVRCYAR